MAMHTIYAAATAASDGTTVPHPVFNATPFDSIVVSADNLAGVEEIDVYVIAGATAIALKDKDGVAVKLAATAGTNNSPVLKLEGGVWYQFRKDATAGACGIYVNEGPGINA